MGHQPLKSVEDMVRIVLAVVAARFRSRRPGGRAARRCRPRSGVICSSPAASGRWRPPPVADPRDGSSSLAGEIEELNRASGEAHMELRLWKKGGSLHSASTPSRRNGPRPT